MNTFVKIEGEPKKEAIEALRKVAVDVPEICIMDANLEEDLGVDMGVAHAHGPKGVTGAGGRGQVSSIEMVMNYFGGPSEITEERCQNIISDGDIDLGEYDFVFEWADKPEPAQRTMLEEKIAKTLKPLDVEYTVEHKG
ncbi:hypothetical protein GF326_09725 [Candidatus Bathyarchaeota archaeon]|nr:hypothetical protein [Candidatus Bathyarchaeota archaeon]